MLRWYCPKCCPRGQLSSRCGHQDPTIEALIGLGSAAVCPTSSPCAFASPRLSPPPRSPLASRLSPCLSKAVDLPPNLAARGCHALGAHFISWRCRRGYHPARRQRSACRDRPRRLACATGGRAILSSRGQQHRRRRRHRLRCPSGHPRCRRPPLAQPPPQAGGGRQVPQQPRVPDGRTPARSALAAGTRAVPGLGSRLRIRHQPACAKPVYLCLPAALDADWRESAGPESAAREVGEAEGREVHSSPVGTEEKLTRLRPGSDRRVGRGHCPRAL